jgi:hypothetical protein
MRARIDSDDIIHLSRLNDKEGSEGWYINSKQGPVGPFATKPLAVEASAQYELMTPFKAT